MRLPYKKYVLLILLILFQFTTIYAVELKFAHPHNAMLHKVNDPAPPSDSLTIQTINILIDQRKISNNNQYQKCFSAEQLFSLDSKVQEGLQIGRQLQENGIENFPKIITEFLHKKFDSKTINCFFNSNDLKTLILSYNVQTLSQAIQAFGNFSYQKFTDTHNTFGNLIQLIKTKDIQNLVLLTDKTLTKIFKQTLPAPSVDEWGIQAIDPQLNKYPYYGITNSNGLIGAVSDKQPFKLSKTVLAGAYDKYGRGRVDNIVETMNLMDMQLWISWVRYPPFSSMNYRQYIDFKKGQFTGSYSSQDKASVSYRYMALKNSPGTFYLETIVTAHEDIQIWAINHHSVPEYMNAVEKTYENLPNKEIYRVMSTKATTKTNKIDVVLSSTFFVHDSVKKYLTGDNMAHEDWDSDMHQMKLQNIKIPKGQVFKFYLISTLVSSQHHSDPKNQAIRLLLKVASTQPEIVIAKHQELWSNLWKNDIEIQGNSQDQRTVRSIVYHFYSFINEFKSYGLSPMGLSGLGYNGHVFWDMDLWMFPAILVLNPNLAKSLIQYRYDRLEAARNNAFLNGYKGTMFPWESSKTGDQECPVWAAAGPLEHHISGTVALAAWKYYCVTKDLEWLKQKGRAIIEGVAEFWQSRVEKDQNGTYHINNVVAADQWAENVDDDAFTNAIAIESFRIANQMLYTLKYDENPVWDEIRKNIIIHKFNDTNVTKQYATYQGGNIKQADVNLLAYPLKQVTDKADILKDLQFYENKVPVEGTPAMTHAIFALLYSRLGDAKKSYQWFKYSFTNNQLTPFGVLAQTQFGTNPYFLTGAGGILQSVIFGYGGIDIRDQGVIKVQTVIPDEWDRVVIKSSVINSTNYMKQENYDKNMKD